MVRLGAGGSRDGRRMLDKRGKDFSRLLYSHPVVGPSEPFDPPRRALVTAVTYGGETVLLELKVLSRARGFVCVEQHDENWGVWLAWIPVECAEPIR